MKYKFILCVSVLFFYCHLQANVLYWLPQPEVDIGPVADNDADDVKISNNGRYITFISKASNLVVNDNNRIADVFIRDQQTGITELVSITASDIQASSGRIEEISAPTSDGRYVAFTSKATAYPEANGIDSYLYIKDMQTGSLVNASTYNGNLYFEVTLGSIHLSDNGQFVTFTTSSQIDPLHSNSRHQTYRKDLANTTFELLSISHDGLSVADANTELLDISENGRFILLSSRAENLTSDVINNFGDNLFINDTIANTMTLVNITPSGNNSSDSSGTNDDAAISDLGQVVFKSEQSDLVNNDNNNRDDVFYYFSGSIIRINLDASGGELTSASTLNEVDISGDGSRIVFTEYSDELFPTSVNDIFDLYAYETSSATISLISKNASGNKANGNCYQPKLSTTGNRMVFISYATDLSNDPTTGQHQSIFHYNFNTDVMKNELLAVSTPNTTISDTLYPRTSSDQMSVIYSSRSPNLVPEPIDDNTLDLFLLDRNTNTHSKIASNISSYETDISASSHFISFRSHYLPPDGITNLGDYYVFLFDRINNTYTQIAVGGKSRVNDDGVVVFTSFEDLDINDTNGQKDIYAYNPTTQNVVLVSRGLDGFASSANDMDMGGNDGNIWVTFSSDSSNIVADDTNSSTDIFLKNLSTGNPISRVTETVVGTESNGNSSRPSISEDGNWIALQTNADNLTSDDYTSAYSEQVMVFDRVNNSLSLVSKNEFGMPLTQSGTGGVDGVSVSDSGRYVTYTYEDRDGSTGGSGFLKGGLNGSNFAADTDTEMDVILFDTTTQTPKIISKHINGLQSDDNAHLLTHIVEDLTVFPPLVGVIFSADGGDLTGLSSHPGHREVYLYQQGGTGADVIFENGFE